MGGIAKKHDALVMPFAGDAMMDLEQVGADDLEILGIADEVGCLLAQLIECIFALPLENGVEKTPELRLTNEDHPFLSVAEIGEVGKVARVLDIKVDIEID